jgi:hypothetical protein
LFEPSPELQASPSLSLLALPALPALPALLELLELPASYLERAQRP